MKTSWNYDDNGRNTGFSVKNSADTELYKKNYTYNAISNIVQKESTGSLPSLDDFTYDPLSRLTEQKKNADGTVANAYEYSAAGNLTKNNAVIQTFDDAGKILTSGTKAFGYDARGNRVTTTDSADATENAGFEWNAANLLVSKQFTKNNTAVNVGYTYSADGLLSSRSKDGQNTNNFVWDASGSIPLLLDDGVSEYIYSDDRTPVAQISKADGTVAYLHSDNIGSVTASTNNAGELVANTEYSPYGVNLGLRISPFGFAGEWTDPDTNHSYLRARWLDTTTGTFLSRDPLVQITNASHNYTGGNPISRVDPLGLDWISDWVGTREIRNDISTTVAIIGVTTLAVTLLPVALPIITAGAAIIASTATIAGIGLATAAFIEDCGINSSSSCVNSGLNLALSALPLAKFGKLISKSIANPKIANKSIEETLGEYAKSKYFKKEFLSVNETAHNLNVTNAKIGYMGISSTALQNDFMSRIVNEDYNPFDCLGAIFD